jgi:hypothetical protein
MKEGSPDKDSTKNAQTSTFFTPIDADFHRQSNGCIFILRRTRIEDIGDFIRFPRFFLFVYSSFKTPELRIGSSPYHFAPIPQLDHKKWERGPIRRRALNALRSPFFAYL